MCHNPVRLPTFFYVYFYSTGKQPDYNRSGETPHPFPPTPTSPPQVFHRTAPPGFCAYPYIPPPYKVLKESLKHNNSTCGYVDNSHSPSLFHPHCDLKAHGKGLRQGLTICKTRAILWHRPRHKLVDSLWICTLAQVKIRRNHAETTKYTTAII